MKKILALLMTCVLCTNPVMAEQHDYVLDNQAGVGFRTDLNTALQAIVTNNAGATAPATLYPNMWWYDSSSGLMKHRDNANTAWITLGLDAADTDGTMVSNSDLKVPTQKAAKTYADTKMSKTGNETVAGVKSFTSFPLTPSSDPTTDYQVANKKYVDGLLDDLSIAPSLFSSGFAGDASDGTATISSNTDIDGTVKQYNNLTINSGYTLTAPNCIIGVAGTLTINGTISANGGGLPSDTSLSYESRTLSPAGGGGGGGGSSSGTGYSGSAGGTSGGYGGAAGTLAHVTGYSGNAASTAKRSFVNTMPQLSALKGAGGGTGRSSYNAGGVGGGFLIIECNELVFNSGAVISANGANGGSDGAYAGGGGGGGGVIIVRAKTITTNSGTIQANGGNGGAGNGGTEGAGGAGGAGYYIIIDVP